MPVVAICILEARAGFLERSSMEATKLPAVTRLVTSDFRLPFFKYAIKPPKDRKAANTNVKGPIENPSALPPKPNQFQPPPPPLPLPLESPPNPPEPAG